MQFGALVAQEAAQLESPVVMFDSGGVGYPVYRYLIDEGAIPNLIKVQWGDPCLKVGLRKRYANQRAQSNFFAARAAREGRLRFLTDAYRDDIINEGGRIPTGFSEKGKEFVLPKEQMRAQGIHSPDLWDAICFLFLENAHYVPNGRDGVSLGAEGSGAEPVAAVGGDWDW